MIIYNNEEIRVIPVRKSLTRPQLICGCDRVLFLLLLLFCMALIFPGGLGSANYVNVVIGIAFFFFGVQVLTVLAKYDPLFSQIFTRAVKYQDAYVGSSLVSRQDKSYSLNVSDMFSTISVRGLPSPCTSSCLERRLSFA